MIHTDLLFIFSPVRIFWLPLVGRLLRVQVGLLCFCRGASSGAARGHRCRQGKDHRRVSVLYSNRHVCGHSHHVVGHSDIRTSARRRRCRGAHCAGGACSGGGGDPAGSLVDHARAALPADICHGLGAALSRRQRVHGVVSWSRRGFQFRQVMRKYLHANGYK